MSQKLGHIIVLNKHHLKGAVGKGFYIGRGSALGNPYTVEEHGRDKAIRFYESWLDDRISAGTPNVCDMLNDIGNEVIQGKDVHLICFCKPLKCHGDYIKYIITKQIAAAGL